MENSLHTIGKLHHKKYGTECNSFDALRTAFADSADSDEAFCDDNSFEERAIGSFEEEEHQRQLIMVQQGMGDQQPPMMQRPKSSMSGHQSRGVFLFF